jgi:hypothetical protein
MKKHSKWFWLSPLAIALMQSPSVRAMADACQALGDTRTNSFEQVWNYTACIAGSVAQAFELMFLHW